MLMLTTDYNVYVRKPIDLGTITTKLENCATTRYNYGDMIADLRRVFSNAKKYNAVHRTTDDTGVSQQVYDAAVFLEEKLEGLLPQFTVGKQLVYGAAFGEAHI